MFNCFRKNKKGTVLFTVIVVMMVLIITMMSTMVVVITAQKKSITNFTDSQSYVTAKSVLDIFINGLTNETDTNYGAIREALIGKYNDTSGKMENGLDYVDAGDDSHRDPADHPKTKYKRDYEVKTNLSDAAAGSEILGVGQILDDKINIRRLDRLTFKVSITVLDGTEFDSAGVLKKGANSSKTVSRIIKLAASPSASVFDSALISCSGTTELMSDSQLYGGYVNATSGTDVTKLNGGTNYIGRLYSKGSMQLGDGSGVNVYLSTRKMQDLTTGTDVYYLDYLESETGINFSGGLNVHNIIPSGESVTARKPDGISNPYIFGSGTGGNVIIGSSSGAPSEVGESGKRVDIYANGDVKLNSVTMYGDIYCKGNVTIQNCNIDGKVFCDATPTITGDAPTGGTASLGSSKFPDGYSLNTYMKVSEILDEEYKKDYDKDGVPDTFQESGSPSKVTIGDCFIAYDSSETIQTVSAPNGTITTIDPDSYVVPGDPTSGRQMVTSVKKGGTTVARAVNLSFPQGFNGTIIVSLGKEDLFINITTTGTGKWNSLFGQNSKIIVQPKSGIAESDLGNVYFYSNFGDCLFSGLQVFTDYNCNGIYDDSERQFGTKSVHQALDLPSHIFWLMNGTGKTFFQNQNMIHGYIYGIEAEMGGPKNTAEAKGLSLVNDTYYDDKTLTLAGTPQKAKPVYVGSCISARSTIGGNSASIFVPPPKDNIFDGAMKITLDKYSWNEGLYSVRGGE